MSFIRISPFVFIVCTIMSGVLFSNVHALTHGVSAGISPARQHILATPGSHIDMSVILTNHGDDGYFVFEVHKMQKKSSHDVFIFSSSENTPKEPSVSLDETSQKSNLLLTDERYTATVSIDVPQNTRNGDYAYVVSAVFDPPSSYTAHSTASLRAAPTALILLTIANDSTDTSYIDTPSIHLQPSFQLTIAGKIITFFDSSQKTTIKNRIENKGAMLASVIVANEIRENDSLLDLPQFRSTPQPVILFANEKMEIVDTLPRSYLPHTYSFSSSTQNNRQPARHISLTAIGFPFRATAILLGVISALLLIYLSAYTSKKVKNSK